MAASESQAGVTQRDAPRCAMAGEGATSPQRARERFVAAVEAAGGAAKAAKLIGCTRAYIDMLRTGARARPGMYVAYLIEQRLGIPMGAWMEQGEATSGTGAAMAKRE